MIRRRVHISACDDSSILAKDIININGVKLAVRNTGINDYIKEKLSRFDIEYIWIYDSISTNKYELNNRTYAKIKHNYMQSVLTIKEILLDAAAGNKVDYVKVAKISDSLYEEIQSTDIVLKCLNDLRGTDEYTYMHCVNVSIYSMLIAKWSKLPKKDIKNAIQAGLLHDVGKMKVPNTILNKKGKLSDDEFNIIKKHSLYGNEIIKSFKCMEKDILDAILMHHERMDGSGYPFGVTGCSLNIYARIVAIADVYDAMISDRVYKSKVTPFEAFKMFMTEGVSLFDTNLVKTFLDNLPSYYVGANVVLDNGKNGKILYIPPYDLARPIINVDSNCIELSQYDKIKILSVL